LGFVIGEKRCRRLFDLGFLVENMFANDGVKFPHFQLLGRRALVLGRGVEMPRTSRGDQFNFVAHGSHSLKFLTSDTQLSEDGVDPLLIDDAHSVAGYPQPHETLFAFDPKPMHMQVWQKAAAGSIVGVGYVVSSNGTLPCHLTNSGHRIGLQPAMAGSMTLAGLRQIFPQTPSSSLKGF